MILHNLLGKHLADAAGNRWDNGKFVSSCRICGRAMVKPVNGVWQLAVKTARH